MKQILKSIGLGLLTPFIGIIGAEPFEVPGQNPVMERIGAGVAVAIYCAVCQFLITRQNVKSNSPLLPPIAAMVLAIGAVCIILIAVEGPGSLIYFGGPILVAGFIGAVSGMILGRINSVSGDV